MKTQNLNKQIAQAVINFGRKFYNGSVLTYSTKNYSVRMFQNGFCLYNGDDKIETFE